MVDCNSEQVIIEYPVGKDGKETQLCRKRVGSMIFSELSLFQ